MTDTERDIQRLVDANPIREPVLRSVIGALDLPDGSRGLDVGCGIGFQARLLAEAVGPRGHVTGVDISPAFLARGRALATEAGLGDRIEFRTGDMRRLPFGDGAFDWAWSADCVGYPTGDPASVLDELVRVVRPGGTIVLLGWSSQQVLPGHPVLEARLNATASAYLPYLAGKDADQHYLRAGRWFKDAGLEETCALTFVGDVRAPLSPGERVATAALFEMLWVEPGPGSPRDDWDERSRICLPGSPDFILDEPGYYAFFTYTAFRGTIPAAR